MQYRHSSNRLRGGRHLPDTCTNIRLAAAQFHNRTPTDPDTWQAPAPTASLLAEPTSMGVGLLERGGECLKHGAFASSHGAFLHVAARQTLTPPAPPHYISRDHPNAHEFKNHIRHPSQEPGLRSPGAPGKWLRRWCGMVRLSPTGTTGNFPRIL